MVLYCHFRRRASLLCHEARLSGCSALHIARGCATAETQEIAWQGRAATWGGFGARTLDPRRELEETI